MIPVTPTKPSTVRSAELACWDASWKWSSQRVIEKIRTRCVLRKAALDAPDRQIDVTGAGVALILALQVHVVAHVHHAGALRLLTEGLAVVQDHPMRGGADPTLHSRAIPRVRQGVDGHVLQAHARVCATHRCCCCLAMLLFFMALLFCGSRASIPFRSLPLFLMISFSETQHFLFVEGRQTALWFLNPASMSF